MAPTEKPTFFIYEVGRDPEELCLSNLVLKDYANPTLSRHYTHPRMHERDLRTYATITHLTKGWEIKSSSGLNFTPLIPMVDFFKARISWNRKQERVLKADEGFRITLKDPEKFLREQVLSEVEAVQALQIWISGANRGWGSLRKKPKIWMLTGLYLLKDATSTQEKLRKAFGQVGISSTALSPVSGSAIDNSVDLGHSHNSKSQTPTKGLLVWAAQYRALDYHVCKRSAPADIHLLSDVVSQGVSYRGEPDWTRGLRLKLSKKVNHAVESGPASSCDEADYERLYKSFWICKVSHGLMRDNKVHVPANMKTEQQVKRRKWEWAKEDLQAVRRKVGTTEWKRDPSSLEASSLEERAQLAYDKFMIAEKEYKKSLAEFEGPL